MFIREPMPEETSRRFVELAQGSRLSWHMVSNVADPGEGSNFALANELYPWEKVSDRARHYVEAALEHMILWADHVAPLKFHPEQQVNFTMRPTYLLARAAMESAAQVVWMLDTRDPRECIRRHLSLIRWDLEEHRKSRLELSDKERIKEQDALVLERMGEVFTPEEIKPPPGFLWIIQAACKADELTLDEATAERLWRAASGVAHGMYWPNIVLKKVTPGEEYEPGHYRAQSLPDPALMLEVMRAAYEMVTYAAGKYVMWSGADVIPLTGNARRWLADQITLREDHDPAVVERLRRGDDPTPGTP